MSRLEQFTKEERMLIHHALRVFLTHPLTRGADKALGTRLADEIWDEHAAWCSANLDTFKERSTTSQDQS